MVVTAVLGLLTAFLTQRSQYRRTEQEHGLQIQRDLRSARRDSYVRYIVSAQTIFDRAAGLYVQNRAAPVNIAEFTLQPPQELADALIRNETCRVEVLLLAGEQVRTALEGYDDQLRVFWKAVGSGTESDESEAWKSETAAYHRLIATMRAEVSAF